MNDLNGWKEIDESPSINQSTPIDVKNLNPENSNLQSGLKQGGEFLLGIGTKALQAPFNLASLPVHALDYLIGDKKPKLNPKLSFLEQKLPTDIIKDIPGQIESTVEKIAGEGSTKPSNIASQAAQMTVGNWPLLVASGGLSAGKVGADLVGSLFQAGAQNLGYGPMGQIIASSIGQKGFGSVAGLFKKSLKNPSFVDNFKQDLYKKEPELGSKFKVSTKDLKSSLEKTKEKLALEFPHEYKFPESASGRAFKTIDIAEKKLKGPSITGSDLYKIQKELNSVYLKPRSTEGKYFNEVLGAVKEQLNKAADKHSEWGKIWKEADQLHSLQNWESGLTNGLETLASSGRLGRILNNKGGRAVLGALSAGTNAVDALIEQGAGRPALLLNHLYKTESGQKVLWDIIANSAKRDSGALAKSLYKFDKMANEFDSENPDQLNGWEEVS